LMLAVSLAFPLAGITLLLATPRGTPLTCRSCLDRREAFLAGNLTVADANAVERHLADCVDCRSMYGLDPNETPAAARTSVATPIVATAAR
ncbi:MAG: zf-HC2 domain-containing protein, partial [Planctomycetota bacterium]